jgi:hypothetical protein
MFLPGIGLEVFELRRFPNMGAPGGAMSQRGRSRVRDPSAYDILEIDPLPPPILEIAKTANIPETP